MRRFRFHLGTLLILVLILVVGFAAIRGSNETWDGSVFSGSRSKQDAGSQSRRE